MAPGQRKQSDKEINAPRQSITFNCLFAIVIVAKTHDVQFRREQQGVPEPCLMTLSTALHVDNDTLGLKV